MFITLALHALLLMFIWVPFALTAFFLDSAPHQRRVRERSRRRRPMTAVTLLGGP